MKRGRHADVQALLRADPMQLSRRAWIASRTSDVTESACSPSREPDVRTKRSTESSGQAIALAWLLRLRWGVFAAQVATLAIALTWFPSDLTPGPLAAIIAVTGASNLALFLWARDARTVPRSLIGTILLMDTALLTGVLSLTGGPSNPFSILYLVYVTLAALAIGARWAALVVLAASAGYATLFLGSGAHAGHAHMHGGGAAFSLHLQAMWLAFTVAASVIAFLVARVAAALREREAQIEELRRAAARTEKLAALSTLAGGAAHELATPLSTIAVAAKELEHALTDGSLAELADDARLIRDTVERCGTILREMSARAGETVGEAPEHVLVADLVADLRASVGADGLALDVDPGLPNRVRVPRRGLIRALGNLIGNARQADSTGRGVSVQILRVGSTLRVVVEDHGTGMTEQDLVRAGEPFYTTKAVGTGMGLGLFLVRAFAERCQGRLLLDSKVGVGTRATIELPIDVGARQQERATSQ